MTLQVVYVLTNPAMPNLVKIGMTELQDVNLRIAQLYTTGVPFPVEVAYACKVPNAAEVEPALHRAFAPTVQRSNTTSDHHTTALKCLPRCLNQLLNLVGVIHHAIPILHQLSKQCGQLPPWTTRLMTLTRGGQY